MTRRRVYQLPKGLTRSAAWWYLLKRYKPDCRGFTYDRRTGRATVT